MRKIRKIFEILLPLLIGITFSWLLNYISRDPAVFLPSHDSILPEIGLDLIYLLILIITTGAIYLIAYYSGKNAFIKSLYKIIITIWGMIVIGYLILVVAIITAYF
jgi:hypothetical protein